MTEPHATPITSRPDFDKLLEERVRAMTAVPRGRSDKAATPATPAKPATPAAQTTTTLPAPEAVEMAQLLDAQAREFADAVDRDQFGKPNPLPYDSLFVITGEQGVRVVPRDDYYREPIFWRAHVGKVDSELDGTSLVHYLRTGQPWRP